MRVGVRLKLAASAALLAVAQGLAPAAVAQPQEPRIPRPDRELPRPQDSERPSSVRVDAPPAVADCPLLSSPVTARIDSVRYTDAAGNPLNKPEIERLLSQLPPPPPGDQPVAVVCSLRDRAAAALREAGYIATVQIPPQELNSGVLTLRVITARIVEVRIRGDAPPFRDQIAARARLLEGLDPFNERDATEILLLGNDIPGVDMTLSLSSAGREPGDVIGDLNISYTPYVLRAVAQNWGSEQLGRESLFVQAEFYGLTGLADVTRIGASTTVDLDEQQIVQAEHIMGLGPSGATLGGSFIYAWSRPELAQLDLRSESYIASAELTVPLQRSRRVRFDIAGGFEAIEQTIRVFSNNVPTPLNRDRLRVAFLRAEGLLRSPRAQGGDDYVIGGSIELRQGLDILGATQFDPGNVGAFIPSRIAGEPDATVVRAELTADVRLNSMFSLHGRAEAQWASDPLLNFEEYSLGNFTIGRGYDPGANSADRAIALRGEVRADVHRDIQFFVFGDNVWIENLDPNTTETDRALGSYGGGVRARIRPYVFLEAIYARPSDPALNLPPFDPEPDRLLLSLTVQFSPGARR
jgi:hemolysin activation/secretion protein